MNGSNEMNVFQKLNQNNEIKIMPCCFGSWLEGGLNVSCIKNVLLYGIFKSIEIKALAKFTYIEMALEKNKLC